MSERNQPHLMRKQLLISLGIFLALLLVTTLIIFYGKGYRLGFDDGKPQVSKTGLLVTTSIPDGAQVLIDGNLTTATDNTIDLLPGDYNVEIKKEGYFPWQKTLRIQKELVTKASAFLFPSAPKLESITTTGVSKPTLDPSGTKIAFRVASQSATRNGIYIYDMTARSVLSLQTAAKQIANDTSLLFSTADLSWTPDGEAIIATISGELSQSTYLLNANQLNEDPRNISAMLPAFAAEWEQEREEKQNAQIVGLKPQLKQIIADNFQIISWSPDDRKILYLASNSAELPLIVKPRLVGIDTLREVRKIQKGSVYIYDIREDRNTKVLDNLSKECEENLKTCEIPITWFPNSQNLIYVQNNEIRALETDGLNNTVIYAGPFINGYVFPWPDGSRLVILTNFNNSNTLPNLYTISLK